MALLRMYQPRPFWTDANGNPYAGGTVEFYEAGTSTPKAIYSDAAGTVAAANPQTLNAAGRISGDAFLGTGSYKLIVKAADGTVLDTVDPYDGSASGSTSSGTASSAGAAANLVRNGDFRIWQREDFSGTGSSTNADDTYHMDGWYALTQSGSTTISQLTTPEDGIATALRMTQAHGSAQKMGSAQVIPAIESHPLRGGQATIAGRVRCSTSSTIRYLLAAWTGGADNVTSDIVLTWGSNTITPGNFLIASNVSVIASGSVSVSAGAWTDLPAISGDVPSATNNLVLLVWTASTQATGVTLDVAEMRVFQGSTDHGFEARPMAEELLRAQRQLRYVTAQFIGAVTNGQAYPCYVTLNPPMRYSPTCFVGSDLVTPTSFPAASGTDLNSVGPTAKPCHWAKFQRTATASSAGVFGGVYGLSAEL